MLLTVIIIHTCGCASQISAKDIVNAYFKSYNNVTDEVLNDINKVVETETLNDSQKSLYKDILIRQYKDLKYTITKEVYNGDKALVTVNIEVYNYYLVQKNASSYLKNHLNSFSDEKGNYNNSKYMDYKLKLMMSTNERTHYELDISLNRENGRWIIGDMSQENLEKIHGVYNYEQIIP
jgi:hypothetical protein